MLRLSESTTYGVITLMEGSGEKRVKNHGPRNHKATFCFLRFLIEKR